MTVRIQTLNPKLSYCLATTSDQACKAQVALTLMLSLIRFLFKGKRIPPTKTRPLRQGSKKPLLEDDLQATRKVLLQPVPDESKRC